MCVSIPLRQPGHPRTLALLGNVAEIQNFPTSHQDLSMERLATRERGVYLHTLEDRYAEALQEHGRWSRSRSDSDHGRRS